MRGFNTAETPNTDGDKAVITVTDFGKQKVLSIEGKYSHFVGGYTGAAEPEEEPTAEEIIDEEPTIPEAAEGDTAKVRIDVPQKMAVAFADGTVYYGGEMKDVVFGQEYTFQMCSVNWENGRYDQSGNGLCGTVVYRMTVVHQDKFLRLAKEAKQNPNRYTVKGIDIIDNEAKTIIVNGDAEESHLETDVNNFFVAYRFHFANEAEEFDNKTGIDNVVDPPLESLSVNLPVGATITCNAFRGSEKVATDDVFITVNSGEGVYDDVLLTSVNDYTWSV